MSFLDEYLERRRQAQRDAEAQRQLDEASPEELLEALRANTEYTSSLIGERSKDAIKQNKAIVDSLEIVGDKFTDLKHETSEVSYAIEQAGVVEQRSTKITNDTLIRISNTLKEIAQTNRKVEKYLRPELNSKDDTYAKKKEKAQAVLGQAGAKAATVGGGLGLGAIAADVLDTIFGKKEAPKTGKPAPTQTPTSKPSALGTIGTTIREKARVGMSKVGDAASKAVRVTANAAGALGKSALEAAERVAPKAVEAAKPVVSKSAEYLSRAQEALKPAAQSVSNAASKATAYVREAGGSLIEKFKPTSVDAKAIGDVGKVATGAAEAATSPSLWSRAGNLLGKVATPIAVGASGYNIYQTEKNDTLTRDEKNVKHAGTVGGLGGSFAGAAAGATVGSVIPVVGTAIGGIAGGIGGYFLGDKVGETVMSGAQSLRDNMPDSIKNAIGASVALAVSPFSEDARNALKHDLVPKVQEAGDKFASSTKELKESNEKLWTSVSGSFSKLSDSMSEGWEKTKGVAGRALSAAGDLAKRGAEAVGSGVERATEGTRLAETGKTVSRTLSKAGSAVALKAGEIGYDLQKGSANPLELAKGFQGTQSIRGLNEAQTRAYAGDVMKTESGGKLDITNKYGYLGQYQFGAEALATQGLIDQSKLDKAKQAAKAQGLGWYKDGMHKKFLADAGNWKIEGGQDAFLSDKKLQDETFVKFTNANIAEGYRSKALNEKSTAADIGAYAKAAHLVGAGRANDLFNDGKDSADANKTKASKYASQGAKAVTELAAKLEPTAPAVKTTVAATTVAPTTEVPKETPKDDQPIFKVAAETPPEKKSILSSFFERERPKYVMSETATLGIRGLPSNQVGALEVQETAQEPVAQETEVTEPSINVAFAPTETGSTTEVAGVKFREADEEPKEPKKEERKKKRVAPPATVGSAGLPNIGALAGLLAAAGNLPKSMPATELSSLAASQGQLVNTVMANPEMQVLSRLPGVSKLAASGDIAGLASHPALQQAVGSSNMSSILPMLSKLSSSTGGAPDISSIASQFGISGASPEFSNILRQTSGFSTPGINGGLVADYRPLESVSLGNKRGNAGFGTQFQTDVRTVSPDVFTEQAFTPSAPVGMSAQTSMLRLKPSSFQLASPNLPPEVSPVAVTNAPTEANPGRATSSMPSGAGGVTAFDTAVPKLDNIPLQVTDLGLVLLNIGHV